MAKWIVVGSAENFEIARDRGFDMFGFKSSRRRELATIAVMPMAAAEARPRGPQAEEE